MKISEEFPSKFLRAADLPKNGIVLVIADCKRQQYQDGSQQPGLMFRPGSNVPSHNGIPKILGLNKTNATTLSDAYGDDTDFWVGKPVLAYPTEVDFQGRRVAAVRLRIPKGRPAPQPVPEPEPEPQDWSDGEPPLDADGVPF